VLVVDDDRDHAQTLADLLALMGHEAAFATDAASALPMARDFQPDIVFLDLSMPQIDGYTLARTIRATPELEKIGIVAVSGHGDPEDHVRSRQAGFDAHVTKPADVPLIEAILEQLKSGTRR